MTDRERSFQDLEDWQCDNCGFVGRFSNPWAATKLNLETDVYYLDCPFCDGELHEVNDD